jgi:lysophospholipase L1-like esterase
MPDLSLLIASVTKPGTVQEPALSVLSSVPASVFASIPLSCEAILKTSSPPDSALSNSRPCPEFSPVAVSAVPISSSYPQVATSISAIEPALPALLPANLAINPYLPQPLAQPNLLQPNGNGIRPRSGSQLYQQRLEALRQGKTYTRLSTDSFLDKWANASQPVTHDQWLALLKQEATAMTKGQGKNRLTVILGDSISQWLPNEQLSSDRFYLNQGISGDTTGGVLQRLSALDQVHPNTIYVMVGVNDLKNGKTDQEILANLQKIMQRLRQTHPQAKVIINSVLPTRLVTIPSDRTIPLNQQISQLAEQEGVSYLALTSAFADSDGTLRREFTTDGLHLSPPGYAVWTSALRSIDAVTTASLTQ